MNTVKLAEALLRRKELGDKVNRAAAIRASDYFEVKVKRINVTESVDDVTATVPKLTFSQVSAEYDFYAKQLRMVDAAIQQANWTTEVSLNDNVMRDYTDVYPESTASK